MAVGSAYVGTAPPTDGAIFQGNVGIGTTSPGTLNGLNLSAFVPLHIRGTDGKFVVVDSATSNSGFAVNDSSQPLDNRLWSVTQAAGGGKLTFSAVTDGGGTSHKMVIDRAGNVGVGTAAPRGKLEVAGGALFLGDMGQPGWGNLVVRGRVLSANSNIHISPPGGTAVYIDSNYREAGGPTGTVNLSVSGDVMVGGNITAKYQDLAEWVPSTQRLAAGTVVVLDAERTNHVLASGRAYDTSVAGVVSARPGVLLGVAGDDKLMVATTGRVRVKVDASRGAIKVGDLLVTSGVTGMAMKSEPILIGGRQIHAPGTIIGKALEPLAGGVGEILVLLSLQ